MRSHTTVCVVVILIASAGCRNTPSPPPLPPDVPRHDWQAKDEALRIIEQRSTPKTIQATCRLKLTDALGRTVVFDGAFAAQDRSLARLQLLKVGQTVLDYTQTESGRFLWVSPRSRGFQDDAAADVLRTAIRTVLDPMGAEPLHATHTSTRSSELVVEQDCRNLHFDRATLLLRRIEGRKKNAATGCVFGYSRYGGRTWLHSVEAWRGPRRILIRFVDVVLNETLPKSAFTPPGRARPLRSPAETTACDH